jgi:hypothetical protein
LKFLESIRVRNGDKCELCPLGRGALQSSVVFLACEALLESVEGIDRSDFGRLVELELELAHLTELRLTRQDGVRILETLSGKGKAGNAARALLKISGVT